MIICNCLKVSDREIRLIIELGAQSIEDVGDACGAGWGCGGCHKTIERMIAKYVAKAGGKRKAADAQSGSTIPRPGFLRREP